MITRNKKIVFEGLVVDIEQMDVKVGSKGWHTYQLIRHPGGVGILPLHGDGTISLIRQLRPSVDSVMLEIPAGRLEAGETPEHCGRRELLEETGISANSFESLGVINTSPGVFDEVIHLFIARGLSHGQAEPEHYEDIEVVNLSFTDAVRMALSGEINDAKTALAIFRAAAMIAGDKEMANAWQI